MISIENTDKKFQLKDLNKRTEKTSHHDSMPLEQDHISALIEPYRGELLLHCYHLLGSLHDAEDMVQESMLRAWRHFETFRGQASLRTWLYTIATNTCLDALKKKRRSRTLPTSFSSQADPQASILEPSSEVLWLEPFPNSWLEEAIENPEARYTRHESISFAFLTALQLLPPRQRAILLLSDVLDWRASEIAQLLELTVPAVTSALHRARVTLTRHYQSEKETSPKAWQVDTETHTLLSRYMHAWEADDLDGLVTLLKEDAILSMPPFPSWYRGVNAVHTILLTAPFGPSMRHRWRLYPTRANDQPAFVLYQADNTQDSYHAFGIQVLALADLKHPRQIAEVTIFHSASLVAAFGFPLQISR